MKSHKIIKMSEHNKFAIIEQYCDNNSWNGSGILRNKVIDDFCVVLQPRVVDNKIVDGVFSFVASRTLCGKRWACDIPLLYGVESVEQFSERIDAVIQAAKKAYNQCLQAYQESPHTA